MFLSLAAKRKTEFGQARRPAQIAQMERLKQTYKNEPTD